MSDKDASLCFLPQDMHVISTDENQVLAAVQEWNQNDTYNLYISDTRGIYFTLALENVKSSRDPEGNVMIDLYEVCDSSTQSHLRFLHTHKCVDETFVLQLNLCMENMSSLLLTHQVQYQHSYIHLHGFSTQFIMINLQSPE